MKTQYSAKLERLESKLADYNGERTIIEPLLKKGLNTLLKLDSIYETSGIERKRKLVGSMFPEKMTFDGTTVRTGRVNEAAQFIYMIHNDLQAQKKRTTKEIFQLSAREVSSGFEPL